MLDTRALQYIENIMEGMNGIDQKFPFLVRYDTLDFFPLRPPRELLTSEREDLDDIRLWYSVRGIKVSYFGVHILAELTRLDLEELVENPRLISVRKLSPRLYDYIIDRHFSQPKKS